MKKPTVLVIDDEQSFRFLLEQALSAEDFDVKTVGSLTRARQELARSTPEIILLDRRLPDGDGIAFLKELHTQGADGPLTLVITAYGELDNAVEAIRLGAWDYLTKPIQLADLIIKMRKAVEARGLLDRLSLARQYTTTPPYVEPRSASMRTVIDVLKSVSRSVQTPVFLSGPSGVGKQFAAELLHRLTYSSSDPNLPFVEVDCAALSEDQLDLELFGRERDQAGGHPVRRGLLERAHGGTLFLDEIAELSPRSQGKLLKFLDSMRFRRVGGEREIEVSLRVVAATNIPLEEGIRSGRFRADLFHRLAVFHVRIPALSQRLEDLPDLVDAFCRFYAARVKKRISGASRDALNALMAYDYPGNVRELRNLIEHAVILASGPELTARDIVLPGHDQQAQNGPVFFAARLNADNSPPSLETIERQYVARVLDHLEGKRMNAAQALGVSYPTLLKRLRELGLE